MLLQQCLNDDGGGRNPHGGADGADHAQPDGHHKQSAVVRPAEGKKIFQCLEHTGDEFRALADSERIRLGLRCFTLDNEKDEVPTKCNSGILEIDNLLDAMEVESPLFCVCFVGL